MTEPPAVRSGKSGIDRLLIVRTSAMGDIIHALPAVTALRRVLPDTMIGWVVEERWVELLCSPSCALSGPRSQGRPLVDRIHTIDTKRWRHGLTSPDTWRQMFETIGDIRSVEYQMAIDFQGAFRSSLLGRLSRANTRYGFAEPRESIAKMFYTGLAAAKKAHVIEQNRELAEALAGISLQLTQTELPRNELADENCDQYLRKNEINKFALLNPGAGWGAKQWPMDRYGQVANNLSGDGIRCLVNYGPGEKLLAESVRVASADVALPIELTLTELIAFIRRASLFIGGDTGPLHLACALGVPVVAIFGPTDPARNGPFGTRNIVLRDPSSITSHKRHTAPENGLRKITVDQVVAAARELMRAKLA